MTDDNDSENSNKVIDSEMDKQIRKEKKRNRDNGTKKKFRTRASITFYYIIVVLVIAFIFGIINSTLHEIQPTGKWEWFIAQSFGIKFTIIGVSAFVLFLLLVAAWFFYKKGNKMIYKFIYPEIKREKITKHNRYAQVISICLLISLFFIFIGGVLVILQLIFGGFGSSSVAFTEFYFELPPGLMIMVTSLFLLVVVMLIISFVWIWENGYHFVVNKLLKYNKVDKEDVFTQKETIIGGSIYGITMGTMITLIFGIIWAIADYVQPEGKLADFLEINAAYQFMIIGLLSSLLFVSLIIGLTFFQRGNLFIKKKMFKRSVLTQEEDVPTNKMARFIAAGILLGLIIIMVGIFISLIQLLVDSTGTGGTFFENLVLLPNGLLIMIISSFILGALWMFILIWATWQNGYYWVLIRLVKIHEAINKDEEDL